MLFSHRAKKRPAEAGPWPTEILKRQAPDAIHRASLSDDPVCRHEYTPTPGSTPLAAAARMYASLFAGLADGKVAQTKAPLPDDPRHRLKDIRGAAYFMDADQVGVCQLLADDFQPAHLMNHDTAIVIAVEHGRIPESTNLARQWVAPAVSDIAQMRAGEIAVCIAGHIRNMGYAASAHLAQHQRVHVESLAIRAGVAHIRNGRLFSPFLSSRFSLAVITTQYRLPHDRPLSGPVKDATRGLRFWWGVNGARSGRELNRRKKRPSHRGKYPMEQVRKVDRPTTLVNDDEVPRVPKRAAFFERALYGDLGEKARRERSRFAFKTPLSSSQLDLIKTMVPWQNGEVAELTPANRERYSDPSANARALKSLSYALGADITGICEIPSYAWFSHNADGTPIEPYHRYAVVMVVDQGFDTMEGASGDDWISGAQSMRSYLRGAEIAGVMAQMLRDLGFSARSQTNADSDLLQIPLMLQAGLGELSRIGELVLNPFVGPRLKSVVLTLDMPLEVDRPIDFGLQYFCQNCYKCARECPCDAIPFGDKVMFNGYEMWKPDVERCTRYRLTNQKGSACGRCMKTCPLNKLVDADGGLFPRFASWLGINAMILKPLLVPVATRIDDWLGNGRRNLVKKWWFDHEMVDGVAVIPKATNEREIDPDRPIASIKQKIAYYPASVMPRPDSSDAVVLDRKAALAAALQVETPSQSRARRVLNGEIPVHYVTPATLNAAGTTPLKQTPQGPYRSRTQSR